MIYKLKRWLLITAMSLPPFAAQAQTPSLEERDPTPSDKTLQVLLETARDVAEVALNTQVELSDFELALMAGQSFRTGDKRTNNYPVRICEITDRTGGGILVSSFRAKEMNCDCERFEILYGTPNDRGISTAALSESDYRYLLQRCSHSVRVYR